MAISLIGVTTCVGATTGALTSTISFSSFFPRGADVVYACGGTFNSATGSLVAIGPTSNSASYITLVASSTVVGGVEFGAWRMVASDAPTTDRIVFAAPLSTLSAAYGAMILRGVASTSPEDITTVFTSGSSVNPQSPAITTQFPNSWVLSMVGINIATPAMTVPSSYVNSTILSVANTGSAARAMTVGIASRLVAATAVETPGTWTSTVTAPWFAVTIAVRAYVPPTSTAVPIDYPPELFLQPLIAQ